MTLAASAPAERGARAGFELVEVVEPTRRTIGGLVAGGFVGLVLGWWLFFGIHVLLTGEDSLSVNGWAGVLGLAVATLVVAPLHELAHGVAMLRYGARPRFGVGPGYAYCTSDALIPRNGFLVVALAPLVALSVIGVAAMLLAPQAGGWIALALALNAGGAVGDVWSTREVLRHPPDTFVEDRKLAFAVWRPRPAS